MAGRAGRRGLDSTGTVIIMANQSHLMPAESQLKQMLLGEATKLSSQFKITYSMILYLHRSSLQTPQVLAPSLALSSLTPPYRRYRRVCLMTLCP